MHSYMLALIKPEEGADDAAIEATLYRLMAPYSENLEVEPYEDDCWCYDIPELPDPKCEDCHGTGRRMTTGNPQTRYDFWKRGGRYTGMLAPPHAYLDDVDEPDANVACPLCNKGPEDWEARILSGAGDWEYCMFCGCTGLVTKQVLAFREWDVMPVQAIGSDFIIPTDVLTPDGKWKSLDDLMEEGPQETWQARREDARERWEPEVRALMTMYSDCLAVVVDYHI